MTQLVKLNVNGKDYEVSVESYESLLSVLRCKLMLTGARKGCDTGGCGCCTIIIEGKNVYSCMYPALKAVGKKITTIEGMAKEGKLDTIQEAFIDKFAIQCGFCTPGMIMSAKALLDKNPNPSEADIREGLSGNLCRCTGYTKIFEAIMFAADKRKGVK